MKNITRLALILSLSIAFFQCNNPTPTAVQTGTKISGKINGAANLQVFIDRVMPTSQQNGIGQANANTDGYFELEIPELTAGLYQLRIGTKRSLLVLKGNEKNITINGEIAQLPASQYTISGSKEANIYKSFINQHAGARMIPPNKVKAFIDTTSSSMAAVFLAYTQLKIEENKPYYEKATAKFIEQHPDSPYLEGFSALAEQAKKKEAQAKAQRALEKIKVGEIPPDISLPSPDGKVYTLSDLKGKIVLVDFWASWCRPCRVNNPALVQTYQTYKDRGFTVYSVSLDKKGQENRWKAAIEKDNLTWDYHVSDLKGWQCQPAREYGVRGIPRTFLLDREGRIAAINPKGARLNTAIEKLL